MKIKNKQLSQLNQPIRQAVFNSLSFSCYPQTKILIGHPLITETRNLLRQSLKRLGKQL